MSVMYDLLNELWKIVQKFICNYYPKYVDEIK